MDFQPECLGGFKVNREILRGGFNDYEFLRGGFNDYEFLRGGFNDYELLRGGLKISEALVLDNERSELVKATTTTMGGGGRRYKKEEGILLSNKSVMALKNHSEAERRRRERINAHLATLRGLVPCTDSKMEKAAILAKVVTQVKELKKKATEAGKGFLIPDDTDNMRVEQLNNGLKDGKFLFRASLCCAYRPDLFSDLKRAIDTLHLNTIKAEMSTLDGRVINVFVFTSDNDDITTCGGFADSIKRALSSVMENASSCLEYSPRTILSSKRRRISYLDSSSSSS